MGRYSAYLSAAYREKGISKLKIRSSVIPYRHCIRYSLFHILSSRWFP